MRPAPKRLQALVRTKTPTTKLSTAAGLELAAVLSRLKARLRVLRLLLRGRETLRHFLARLLVLLDAVARHEPNDAAADHEDHENRKRDAFGHCYSPLYLSAGTGKDIKGSKLLIVGLMLLPARSVLHIRAHSTVMLERALTNDT